MTELGLTMPKASDTLRMDQEGLIVASEAETRVSLRTLLFFRAARAFLSAYDEEWATGKLEALYSRRAEIRSIDASALDDRSLAAVVSELFDLISEQCAIRFRAHLVPMMLAGKALRLRMRLAGVPRGFAESDFLAGIEYESAVIEARLYALAEAAEALPAVSRLMLETDAGKFLEGLDAAEGGPAFREKLGAFLEEHGARTPTPFLAFSSRSWSERPEDLIAGIAAILRSGAAKERPEQLARSAERSAVAERAVERSLLGGAGFRRSLARYRACFMGRERGLYEIEASFVLLRALIAESAARLLRAGLLESADDIGFAREDELVAALGGEGVEEFSAGIARRKAGRPRALREWAAGGTAGKGALRGAPSAAGLYRGRARIIRGPEDFPRLQRGEVLVCPYTDPTWTALFALAQAVIAETGGPLSHAAIVAREYSIPAVMGVKGAMASLADGQFVEVDGTRGEIRRIPSLDGFSAGKGIGNGQRVL
jgi:pyruvate,water dikinase